MDERFGQYLVQLFGDTPRLGCDAAYLFGETASSEQSSLERGAQLFQQGVAQMIAIPGFRPITGYPGAVEWRQKLLAYGVPDAAIQDVGPWDVVKEHTHTEAVRFVTLAKQKGWRHAVIVAPHFHLPRAFLSAASVTIRSYPELRLYAVPGMPLPWSEVIVHNQGVATGRRSEFIMSEFERITRYTEQGNLLPIGDVLTYLDARPGASS